MAHGDDQIRGLRDALGHSPDNRPLRVLLANTLAGLGRHDEAEQVLREAMADAPDHIPYKVTLARVYYQMGKQSQAFVILEALAKRRDLDPAARVLFARLLLGTGDVPNAVAQYKLAIEADPAAADLQLAGQLGISSGGSGDSEAEVVEGRVRQRDGETAPQQFDIERPKIDFKSIGGMDAIKEEIAIKILYPLKHPEMYQAYGKQVGGGILMYGPPGCGKTHLARATAGELSAGFLSVGISDVLDMWVGNSERNLHELFEQARTNKPCVLFFDEVDALGGRRGDFHGHGRQLVNQFLAELDGISSSNEGVLILAATNAPWHVDSAFRRPGRFDRVLFVPPPDTPARADILRIHLRGKPQEAIDLAALARATEHFSGADLKAVVDMAIEQKLREAMKTGIPHPLTTADLTTAATRQKATTREWFSTARNYVLYSNQGGLYDDVAKYLGM